MVDIPSLPLEPIDPVLVGRRLGLSLDPKPRWTTDVYSAWLMARFQSEITDFPEALTLVRFVGKIWTPEPTTALFVFHLFLQMDISADPDISDASVVRQLTICNKLPLVEDSADWTGDDAMDFIAQAVMLIGPMGATEALENIVVERALDEAIATHDTETMLERIRLSTKKVQ